MNKEDVVHIYNWILLTLKNAICSNMDATRDCDTKWSKSERERQVYSITDMWNKIWHKWTCLQNRNRLIDVENRVVVAKGEGGRERDGLGVCRCKLLHIEWINNKVLMYIRGNYIEYLVLNHNGNTHTHTHIYIFIYIYIYIKDCLCVCNWVTMLYSRGCSTL